MLSALWLVASASGLDCSVSDSDKFDCGFAGVTQQSCEDLGCCWKPLADELNGIPWCYYSPSCFVVPSSSSAPFSADEIKTMRGYFVSNLNVEGKGGIAASPDHNTAAGSYYFDWMRDGALSMRILLEIDPFTSAEPLYRSYVNWVLNVQNMKSPNNLDVRTEPKFELPRGEVNTGGWCRPQSDGPGLRATTLILFAEALRKNKPSEASDYIKSYLWTGSAATYKGGAVKYDLDWVAANWTSKGCDLWEDLESDALFWNRYNFHKALVLGANFAASLGDTASRDRYTKAAQDVAKALASHWNGQYLIESTNRPRDGAVITGLNFGYHDGGLWPPTDTQVASTIKQLTNFFCEIYPINTKDLKAGLPGVLIGRYAGDVYAGGNPWVLLSAALATLFYRGGSAVLGGAMIDEQTLQSWSGLFRVRVEKPFASNGNLTASARTQLATAFLQAGDGVLQRVRSHVSKDGFHLYEQIDKFTGTQVNAHDLTWSYAEVLRAVHQRSLLSEQL